MIKVLLFIWQIFQNILGFLFIAKPEYKSTCYGINIYYLKNFSFLSFTLGQFTIMDYYYCGRNSKTHKTQKGYSKLSMILGPFYIFIIFIPQIIINIIARFKTKDVFELNKYLDNHYPNNFANLF